MYCFISTVPVAFYSNKSGVNDRGQISHFVTPIKIRGWVGENAEQEDRADPMTKPVAYI